MATFDEVLEAIRSATSRSPRIVVGVSGYGGAGKSTLARRLLDEVPGSVRIRGDDFLHPELTRERSADWAAFDRTRLRAEVLEPFRAGRPGTFRRLDWATGTLGPAEPLPAASVLVVDAVGLFHHELDGLLDVRIWVDVDLDTATERGRARDLRRGDADVTVWDDVWAPNERDFAARHRPRERADLRYDASA
ncbi:uridine kinase family protein [Agromyces mariniharenae]|uniref:uridine kinase family protein n=1 Tax=Agromyces mariniharenae TaxID=2604423 RepID=UPI001EE5121F|nr:phosphoglycerate transporter [Agromyces mariniharenae]